MGFLDKAKQQATQLAQKAQEGVKTGQAKLDQAQIQEEGGRAAGLSGDLFLRSGKRSVLY